MPLLTVYTVATACVLSLLSFFFSYRLYSRYRADTDVK